MKAAIASLAYPKKLELHNTFVGSVYHLRLKDVAEIKEEIVIEDAPGWHKLIEKPFACSVTEAAAILGLSVEILEPRGKAYLEKCKEAKVSMTLDKEDVIRNEPLPNCSGFLGKNFMPSKVLFSAVLEKECLGKFIPNGTMIEVDISGLAKTKAFVRIAVTIDMAVYTTKA